MGDNFSIPNPGDMYDNAGWGKFYGNVMRNPQGPMRTTASMNGTVQYAATSTSLSDVLQGTLNYRDPVDIANFVNVAFTKQVQSLEVPGLTQFGLLGTGASNLATTGADGDADPYTGNTTPDATEPSLGGSNTPDQLKYAGTLLKDHPNFWIDTEDWSNGQLVTSGAFSKVFVNQLLNGFTPDTRIKDKILILDDSGKAFLFPNLINIMWYICDNGFLLGRTSGFAGYKESKPGKPSQHSYGGAGDIHRVGRAKENVTYEVSDTRSHAIIREIYELIDQLPEARQPTEVGGPFEPTPGSKEDIYYTNAQHKDHLHIGFSPGKEGSLFSRLIPKQNAPGTTADTGVK